MFNENENNKLPADWEEHYKRLTKGSMKSDKEYAAAFIAGLILLFLAPYFVQLVWNNILVEACTFKALNYWQCFWMYLVAKLALSSGSSKDD